MVIVLDLTLADSRFERVEDEGKGRKILLMKSRSSCNGLRGIETDSAVE